MSWIDRFKNMAIYLLISIISIVVLEGLLRLISPINIVGYTFAYEYDSELGIIAKKNLRYINVKDYREEFHTNRIGTVNFSEDFRKYRSIVYALGDSYTQGTGLPSDSSYPAQLDMLLNVRDGKYHFDYAVINLGLGGYGSIQQLRILNRFIESLPKPDYILVMGSGNDAWDDYRIRSGLIFKNPMEGNPIYGFLSKPIAWFAFKTEIGKHAFMGAKTITSLIAASDKSKIPSHDNSNFMITALYDQYKEILTVANQHKAKVIFTFAGNDKNYLTLKKWATEEGARFADWVPVVESVNEAIPAIPRENDHSGGHYRPWVNYIIAKTFAQEISDGSMNRCELR